MVNPSSTESGPSPETKITTLPGWALALLIVAAFVVFAFVGDELVTDKEMHATVLTAFVALTGSVTGYYFGARTGQTLDRGNDGSDKAGRSERADGEEQSSGD